MEDCIKESVDNLLLRIKDNDTKALDELYDLSAEIFYRSAFSYLKNKEDSEDALADAFYLIVKNISSFKGKNGFNWIYTIIKNVSLNMIKKKNKSEYMDPTSEEDINKYSLEADNDTKDNKASEIIEIAKVVLKPAELNILLLHTMNDLKFKDIGNMIGKPEATVRWKYNNALGKLKKELERRNITNE